MPHIVLDTADVSQSPRAEVSDRAIADLQATLARIEAGERNLAMLGTTVTATADRDGLMVTALTADGERPPLPIVTFGVAGGRLGAAELWQTLHQDRVIMPPGGYATKPHAPSPPPWLAVRMEIGAAMIDPAVLRRLPGFERVVAWAWLARRAAARGTAPGA